MTVIDALNGPSQAPANGKPATAAVILLHGYGSDGNDLIGLAPYFANVVPHAVFYSPHAHMPLENGPFGGYQWFSLRNYNPELLRRDPELRAKFMESAAEDINRGAEKLNRYIDQVLAHHDLKPDRLVLLGFSQGCMMSLYVGLRRAAQIAGIIGYSGELLRPQTLATEMKSKPPVALIHGTDDPMVPVHRTVDAEKALIAAGVPCRSLIIPGLQHGIDNEGAQFGAAFMRSVIG
jgi:phospholipase/carboxylesterase